ncbi:MAG: V-type ATP synthase subunit D [Clostridia bacterium]|nr:V-type ATP synthase subunit D [Clostridia bacterium]
MTNNPAPTKSRLMETKASLELAQTGYDLMDRKRSIYLREAAKYTENADKAAERVRNAITEAYAALRVSAESGDSVNIAAACTPVENTVTVTIENVIGIDVPTFRTEPRGRALPYPLGSTSARLDKAYFAWGEVAAALCGLATVRAAEARLVSAAEKTSRRENALGNVMIPRLKETERTITETLEEREREEFSRLKVIKADS